MLAVTPLYPPMSLVGAWLATHRCLRHMVERGHEVHVRTTFAPLGYDVDGVQVLGRWDKSVIGYDAVVSHHGGDPGVHVACEAEGRPHVLMIHGASEGVAGSPLTVWNSESSRDGRDGIVVRPHVDCDEYRATPGDRITLINLSSEKGGELFDLISTAMPRRRFLAVRGAYGRQRRMRQPNVETIPTTSDMADDVYGRTRILLMPSSIETWGRTGIEAMCSGIPVIAHPTPGLVESLGDAGIFVDRTDLRGWMDAIEALDDPDTYAAASAAAERRAQQVCEITTSDLDRFAELMEGCV